MVNWFSVFHFRLIVNRYTCSVFYCKWLNGIVHFIGDGHS